MKKYFIYTLLILPIVSVSFFVWQSYQTKAKAAKVESEILKEVSADDIRAVLTSNPATAPIAEEPESQRVFLKGLREYLALAAEGRREGLADDPRFKLNFAYKKELMLADSYEQWSLKKGSGAQNPSPDEVKLFWADPVNETRFNQTMDAISAIQQDVEKQRGNEMTVPRLAGEAVEKARRNWARAHIVAARAKAAPGFADSNEIQLRLKILEAGILSADYLRKNWAGKILPTETEIDNYIAAHPEYHRARKAELARDLLSKIKAGEDFASIARIQSEDRTSKSKGGLYENVSPDLVWQEVEKAALSLDAGQVYPELVESSTGFHIVKLEKKTGEKDSIRFTFRHILIQYAFEDPNHHLPEVPAPFVDARTIAKKVIETEKRDRFLAEVLERAGVVVPESL